MSAHPKGSPVHGALVGILLLLVGMLSYRLIIEKTSLFGSSAVSRVVTPRGDLAEDEKATIALFRNAAPSVVFITTSDFVTNQGAVREVDSGQGSGIVWDKEGHIVTNYHVIAGAIEQRGRPKIGNARVTLADGSTWDAQVLSFLREYDLAVLRIDAPASRLTPLAVGTSEDLQIGQKVFAIGNPFGLDHTLTTGVIGGLHRTVPSQRAGAVIEDMVQTDAAINPGNSGGPLLDSAGRMIGVNTMIYSPSGAIAGIGQNTGVSFAVPVDTVNAVVPQLIQGRYGTKPGLGVGLVPDDRIQALKDRNLIPNDFAGAVVEFVAPGSAASEAGMQTGDVIVAINNETVRTETQLRNAIAKHHIGDTVDLQAMNRSGVRNLQVTLQALLDERSLQREVKSK